MSNRPIKSFFSSGFQAISVQVFGGIFFYILSVSLSKHEFGVLNWSTAISLFITTILGFGLDQVVVRRIALNSTSDWAAAAYFLHNLAGAIISFVLLVTFLFFYDSDRVTLRLLPWIYVVQCFTFIALPFRQFLNAKERFAPYGIISFISNIGKIAIVLYLAPQYGFFKLEVVIGILAAFSFLELVLLFLYVKLKFDLNFSFKTSAYKKLIKESSAQYLSVLFDSSLSRMDWILLGLISAQMALADYSFAYRAYEMMKLPIVVIGAVILPRFARMLSAGNVSYDKRHEIQQFIKMEVVLACFLVLTGNILWTPVVDAFSHGKYGASNHRVFMILSVCLPLHFLINLFWTLVFSAKKYRYITIATIVTAVLNIVFNLVFIPFMGAEGAAIAFALATLVQVLVYAYLVRKKVMNCDLYPLLITGTIMAGAFAAGYFLTENVLMRLLIALVIYTPFVFIFKQMGREQIGILKSYLKR